MKILYALAVLLALVVAYTLDWIPFIQSEIQEKELYRVAQDSSWDRTPLAKIARNFQAFTGDLLTVIATEEKIQIQQMFMVSEKLEEGLRDKHYEAIFTTLMPNDRNRVSFDFSDSFYDLGPVLVTRIDSKINGLNDLSSSKLGIARDTPGYITLVQSSQINIISYDSAFEMVNDLMIGELDAVMMEGMVASNLVRGIHRKELRIASRTLSDEGVRLVVLKGQNQRLFKAFNEGLNRLQGDKYDELIRKWEI